MSTETSIKCDGPGCKSVRGEGNKWLSFAIGNDETTITFGLCGSLSGDVCSERCAHALLSQAIEKMRKREADHE